MGANTKLGGLPGSTGDPVRPLEVVTVITACDDGTSKIVLAKVYPNSLVLPFLIPKVE